MTDATIAEWKSKSKEASQCPFDPHVIEELGDVITLSRKDGLGEAMIECRPWTEAARGKAHRERMCGHVRGSQEEVCKTSPHPQPPAVPRPKKRKEKTRGRAQRTTPVEQTQVSALWIFWHLSLPLALKKRTKMILS